MMRVDAFANGGSSCVTLRWAPPWQLFLGRLGERARQIEPRPGGRGEMGVTAWLLGQPVPDQRGFAVP